MRNSVQSKPIKDSFRQNQETLVLLKLLALGSRDIAAGRTCPARDVVERLKGRAVAKP